MSGESRRVLLLGLVALVLGGYTYLTTVEKKASGPTPEQNTERIIFDFTPEEVTQIDLFFDEQQLVCQRTPAGWQKVPTGDQIRQDAVDDFLTNLKKLVNLGEVESSEGQLSEYGLKPPASRIALKLGEKGNRILTLTLGKRNPVQTSLYAQINESPQVVLVGAVVLWDLRKLVTAAGSSG